MKLLNSQKNALFELVEESGLSPNLFTYQEPTENDSSTYLRVKNSDYFFEFTSHENKHYSIYSPGDDTIEERRYPGSWNLQLTNVRKWITNLERELDSPNKWDLLEEEIKNSNFDDIEYDNTKFTHEEFKLLESKINDLKIKIEKLDLIEEDLNTIHKKLDHLLKLSEKMNKNDWKNLFIGTLISITAQLTIDKETGATIFGLARETLVKFLPSGS